jgi:GTPase SAR1 family protein
MKLSGRPLLATKLDAKLFVDRPELTQIMGALNGELNVLLVGGRGSGKTSLLRQAARRLHDDDGIHALYIDALRLADASAALVAIADELRGEENPVGLALRETLNGFTSQPGDQLRDQTLRLVRALRVEDQTVVMLDGLDPEVAHTLFGRLRDEIWQTGIVFLIAGESDNESEFLTPPADAFFDRVVRLQPLDDLQQQQLIARRRERDDPDWSHLRDPNGNPRALLATLRQAQAAGVEPDAAFARRNELETRASTMGRVHSMILAEIENGVVASAADADLLDRLGISRQRAQQVLTDLERGGLVQSATSAGAAGAAGGRPRKVFWRIGGEAS